MKISDYKPITNLKNEDLLIIGTEDSDDTGSATTTLQNFLEYVGEATIPANIIQQIKDEAEKVVPGVVSEEATKTVPPIVLEEAGKIVPNQVELAVNEQVPIAVVNEASEVIPDIFSQTVDESVSAAVPPAVEAEVQKELPGEVQAYVPGVVEKMVSEEMLKYVEEKVSKSGDTMTGPLKIEDILVEEDVSSGEITATYTNSVDIYPDSLTLTKDTVSAVSSINTINNGFLLQLKNGDEIVNTIQLSPDRTYFTKPVAQEAGGTGTSNIFNFYKEIYPVGTILLRYDSTSPASLFGGTWEKFGTGRVLRSSDDVGTGGADNITLTTAQMPSHSHSILYDRSVTEVSGYGLTTAAAFQNRVVVYRDGVKANPIYSTGGGNSHSNLPAYQNCYVWRRTA